MSITVDSKIAQEVASQLLEIEAVKLSVDQPFTWTSGWKSPIYCDNRLTLSFPKIRKRITELLVEVIQKHFSNADLIAGVATAGIPQGALIAEALDLPFVYVRSKAKSHGMTNLIEGKVEKGAKCVVIEDLVSTGGSSLKAASDLRLSGVEIVGMASIFTYGFDKAQKQFENEQVDLCSLCDYNELIQQAIRQGIVSESHLEKLSGWREAPQNWGK